MCPPHSIGTALLSQNHLFIKLFLADRLSRSGQSLDPTLRLVDPDNVKCELHYFDFFKWTCCTKVATFCINCTCRLFYNVLRISSRLSISSGFVIQLVCTTNLQ